MVFWWIQKQSCQFVSKLLLSEALVLISSGAYARLAGADPTCRGLGGRYITRGFGGKFWAFLCSETASAI